MTTRNFTATSVRLIAAGAACLMVQGCFASFSAANPDVAIKEPLQPENVMKSGWEYMDQRAYGAAIQSFRIALQKEPDNLELQFGLAEAYRHAGYLEQAESKYAGLIDNPIYKSGAFTGIGHVKLLSYDTDGAFEMFSAAVVEDQTSWKAWLGLAQLRDLANNWGAADEAYKSALSHTSDRALVLNNHGVSMLARGDAKTALVYFDMAEAIEPQSKRVQTNIELAQAMLDDAKLGKDEHLDSKTRARKLNNYGYVAMLRGDREDAERYFLAAIDTHPSFYTVAHKNLQTLRTSKPRTQ